MHLLEPSPPAFSANPQRSAAIALRRSRTFAFGPCMRLQFENRETIRHQVAEVLRTERITDPRSARDEADAYAHLLPDGSNWKATLFIELPDANERARELPHLNEAVHRLRLDIPGHGQVIGLANEDLPDGHRTRPSAVHFVRFQFSASQRAALWRAEQPLTLRCLHGAYPFIGRMELPILETLRPDLAFAATPGAFARDS